MSRSPWYRVERTDDFETVLELDRKIFPGDDRVTDDGAAEWWIAIDVRDGEAVAFGGAKLKADGCAAFVRAGVLERARGAGLQRRLIEARVKWARRQLARGVYTYTADWNVRSANNLIACGFKLWRPSAEVREAYGKSSLYFWRSFT